MSRAVCINELLCYLFNNSDKIDDAEFIYEIMDFYNCEDIRIAKKILTSDLDALNLEKDDKIKPNSSGNSKKDKVSDLILTIKTILSNKIESKLPQYAALNLFKIPSSKKAKFESILDEKLKKLEELFIEERNIFREIVNDAAINNSPKTSAAFRVCIYETNSAEFMNAENWPDQIIVREWCFNDPSANVVNDLKSKRGGGVGVFIKHDIKYVVNDNSAFDDENVDVLCVDIESGHASPRARIKVLCMSLKHTGPGIWETIPQEIKDCNTLHLFKNKLKNFLITKSSVFQG
ncbi:hypothetical protein HELRODRAFT_162308 [Helobdella robusta]|uniref:Uncharacterized protein n=2 Tax=Helobdella robusta TaxID=6412 RepID=T1ESH7_HELRO|nr:hypothetical protein HELRODRAFT_162308 [Helobdella robusta]ESN98848.1 hypothetical protein HELRODRAFT_162308 [Helobdella robusta]